MEARNGKHGEGPCAAMGASALGAGERDFESVQEMLERGEQADRSFAARLSALVEISNELSMTENVDALCRRAVELGCSRLGFDRLGIWFRTGQPGVVAGSFGVDARGRVIDERSMRTRLDAGSPDGRILLSDEPFSVAGEDPMVNSLGQTVGRASQIFAAVWDGCKVVGHVSADNSLGCRPIEAHHLDLLRMFGSVIGYLCARKRIEEERESLIEQLRQALGSVKTLSGLLPICSNCKNIRDDHGYWKKIETYIHEHSEADFTHGLCPDCLALLYPDLPAARDQVS